MKNPNFTQPFHNIAGVIGIVTVFASAVIFARVSVHQEYPTTFSVRVYSSVGAQVDSVSEDVNSGFSQDKYLEAEQSYQQLCATCHGMPGAPRNSLLTGSDLFDAETIRGNDAKSIKSIILTGVLQEGMVPYSAVLKDDEVDAIVEYILLNMG